MSVTRPGVKTERGWKVSKKTGDVIDGLAALVMATYGAEHLDEYVKPRPTVYVR